MTAPSQDAGRDTVRAGSGGTKKKTPGQQEAATIEWIIGAFSGIIVAAMIGYLGWSAVATDDAVPELIAEIREPIETEHGRQVRYRVTNAGGRAASAVEVSLIVGDGSGAVEKRTVVIDYVPADSHVQGGFVLRPEDEAAELSVTVEGYVDP